MSKKIRTLFISVIIGLLSTISCQKDSTNLIVGKWHLTKDELYQNGALIKVEEGALDLGTQFYTFTEYGQLIHEIGKSVYNFEYDIDGDRIYTNLFEEPESYFYTIKKLTKKELVLSYGDSQFEDIEYYQRVE